MVSRYDPPQRAFGRALWFLRRAAGRCVVRPNKRVLWLVDKRDCDWCRPLLGEQLRDAGRPAVCWDCVVLSHDFDLYRLSGLTQDLPERPGVVGGQWGA